MQKLIFISLIILAAAISGCKDPCKGQVTYTPIDNRLMNYVFKPGSYWVYRDSVDGITDSQYVCDYTHIVHYEYLKPDTIQGINHNECLAPLYKDYLNMKFVSYYNNVFNDTLILAASYYNTLSIFEHYYLPSGAGIPSFRLDYNKIGLIEIFESGMWNAIDTSSVWFEGNPNNVISGPYTFPNVSIFRIQIGGRNSSRFSNPTDLYFALGYGIVKLVEHRPSGDVPHNLINFKIIN